MTGKVLSLTEIEQQRRKLRTQVFSCGGNYQFLESFAKLLAAQPPRPVTVQHLSQGGVIVFIFKFSCIAPFNVYAF